MKGIRIVLKGAAGVYAFQQLENIETGTVIETGSHYCRGREKHWEISLDELLRELGEKEGEANES